LKKILFYFSFLFIYRLTASPDDSTDFYILKSHQLKSSHPKNALLYALKALHKSKQKKDTTGIINSYISIAEAHWYGSEIYKALENYYTAFNLCDSIRNTKEYAYCLYAIGWIECVQRKNQDKIHFLHRSLKIYTALHDTSNIYAVKNAIWGHFIENSSSDSENFKSNVENAISDAKTILKLIQSKKYKNFQVTIYLSLLELYGLINQKDSMGVIIKKLESLKNFNLKNNFAYLSNKLNYHFLNGEYDKVIKEIKENLPQYKENFYIEHLIEIYEIYTRALKKKGLYKEALQYTDTLLSLQKKYDNQLLKSRSEDFEYQRKLLQKENAITTLKKINEVQEQKNRQKNRYFIILAVFSAIILFFLIYTLVQSGKIKKLNSRIKEQNHILAMRNREITESMSYASRIQNALLQQNEKLLQCPFISDFFLFYQPKDIVSGDFYWVFHKPDNSWYIGVFDSTGHGIPGSFMSILNMNLLYEAIRENNNRLPNEILNYTRKRLIQMLQLDEKQKDGMDGSLILIPSDFTQNKKIYYACANNPVYFYSNHHLITSEVDKLPIGKSIHDDRDFSLFEITLHHHDYIFLSTDGMKDQFGGDKGKRMGSKKFKELLTYISETPDFPTSDIIQHKFSEWKKHYEQTDDVCVLGFQLR
jgi:serine phosphatase RsbU (regulator of sigma subunit)